MVKFTTVKSFWQKLSERDQANSYVENHNDLKGTDIVPINLRHIVTSLMCL